jgi:hypothetical protein
MMVIPLKEILAAGSIWDGTIRLVYPIYPCALKTEEAASRLPTKHLTIQPHLIRGVITAHGIIPYWLMICLFDDTNHELILNV